MWVHLGLGLLSEGRKQDKLIHTSLTFKGTFEFFIFFIILITFSLIIDAVIFLFCFYANISVLLKDLKDFSLYLISHFENCT